MNDEFLYQLRESPQPEFAEALYERISQEKRGIPVFANLGIPARFRERCGWRWASVGIGVALVLVLALGFTPAGTWAQEVLQRFGITSPPHRIVMHSFSDEELLQKNAGFPLSWPTEFPFDRRRANFFGCLIPTEDGARIVGTYSDAERSYLQLHVFWRQLPSIGSLEDAWFNQLTFSPVTVAGSEGLWAEGVPVSLIEWVLSEEMPLHQICSGSQHDLVLPDGTVVRIPRSAFRESVNVLLWEDSGALYVLMNPERQFSQADLLQTAESMYEDH